ncbi:protein of unknown function [Methylacidimicrobium sp. AP8]|nr:protein of unknown function [Methylacidimicrobium sp. AP8]
MGSNACRQTSLEGAGYGRALGGEEGERQRTVPCGTGVRPCGQPALVPGSEHALAQWLETDYVPDGRGERIRPVWKQNGRVRVDHRFLWPWYRTLDELIGRKERTLGRALCPAAGSLFS